MRNVTDDQRNPDTILRMCIHAIGVNAWSDVTETLPHFTHSVQTAIQDCLENRSDALGVIALRARASTDTDVRNVCRTVLNLLEEAFGVQTKEEVHTKKTTKERTEAEFHDDDHEDLSEALLRESHARIFVGEGVSEEGLRLVA